MTIHNAKWVFLQSNELNALFNICELVAQMVKILWNILYLSVKDFKMDSKKLMILMIVSF